MPQSAGMIEELYGRWTSHPSPALCVRLSGMLRQSGKQAEAFDVARDGLERWPDNISINVVYGKCAVEKDMVDEALKAFEKVIFIDPLNLVALRSLAEIHYKKENWSRAIELFEEYLFEYPGDPEIEEQLRLSREKREEEKREARITGQDVPFPKTKRMASVLSAQGKAPVPEDVDGTTESVQGDDSSSSRAPRSLLALFTEQEREELGLSPFDE